MKDPKKPAEAHLRESDQALFNAGDVLEVDREMVEHLKERARQAPSRRFRLCLHHSPDEAVQEMIVVHCRENYSRPHCHPVATSMMILEGELALILFEDDGRVTRTVHMGPPGTGRPFAIRVEANVWHMPVCRTEQLVFYETAAGPFARDAMNKWARWSPAEDDGAGIVAFFRKLGIDG